MLSGTEKPTKKGWTKKKQKNPISKYLIKKGGEKPTNIYNIYKYVQRRRVDLNPANSLKDSCSERGFPSGNILQVAGNEGVRSRPEGGSLDVFQGSALKESPGSTDGTSIVRTNTVSEESIRARSLDALGDPSRDGSGRRRLEGLNVGNKQGRRSAKRLDLV